ncbi:MAG: EamA family transporter [Clostridiales bacterium]|jgi:transporter family protein|nr:EamA family transporter [Clostridiales bacterium]
MVYVIYALLSAVFSALTAILSKVGLKNISSHSAVFFRTAVVLVFCWVIVFASGAHAQISDISGQSILFLTLSGAATGCSWLCYFKALSIGDVNKVAAVDKSSVTLTMIIGMSFLNESITAFKIIGLSILTAGTYLMLEKKDVRLSKQKNSWFLFALLSAVFASLTSVLAKIGLQNIDSNLGTAFRTAVVLVFAGIMVLITSAKGKKAKASGEGAAISPNVGDESAKLPLDTDGETAKLSRDIGNEVSPLQKRGFVGRMTKRNSLFIFLSGIATGLAWLCYFRALSIGEASVVAPLDKLGVVFTVLLSWIVLKERVSPKAVLGLILLAAGGIMAVF